MYKGVNRVLVGDGTNTGTTLAGIKAGDLLILNEAGTVLTAAAAAALPKYAKITIAAGVADGVAILSSPIQGNTVSKYEGTSYVAPTEQVAYLGFNGTAGTGISVDADTEYRLRILIKDAIRVNGQRSTLCDVNYTASATDTEYDVITKLMNLYLAKDYGVSKFQKLVKVEKVSDDASTIASDNAVTVTNGSDIITFATAATYNTDTLYAVGDVIRLGGSAVTNPIYTITKVDSLNLTIDSPYQGASGTVSAANAVYVDTPTEYGIKLTGIAQSSKVSRAANEPLDQYEWVIFEAALTDANDRASAQYAAKYTIATKTNPGQGYWKQVAQAEEAAKGYLGDSNRTTYYARRINNNVTVGATYDSIVITHANVMDGDFQDTYRAPLQTIIYAPASSAQMTGTATSATAQVETATVVATITEPGSVSVTVTSALITGSPVTFMVPVADNADASAVALAIRTALNAESVITDHYTVSGATDKVILTAKVAAANDSTLNIATDTGTAVGLTPAATSANTTAGSAGTDNFLQILNSFMHGVVGFPAITV